MKLQDLIGAAVSSLLFVTVLLIFVYIYYSLGLPLLLFALLLTFSFVLQGFEIRFGVKPGSNLQ